MNAKISITFAICIFIFNFILTSINFSQEKGFGLGAVFGEPTGLSGKIWIGKTNAIDFGGGITFIDENEIKYSVYLDYLFHSKNIFSSENYILHFGIGGRIKAHKSIRSIWGIRGVAGFDFLPSKIPLEIFIEFAPVFNVVPDFYWNCETGIGIRYYM